MNILLSKDMMKKKTNSSTIQIYHNRQFPLRDIIDILYPLFGTEYPYNGLIKLINTTEHIFCAYDQIQRRSVGYALVNSAGTKGGLYLTLFGVRQSNQHHGVGTQLLQAVIQWARRTRYIYIYLHVNVANFKAIGLYRKVGFRRHEYLPDYYEDTPKENPDAFRMILFLR